MRWDPERTEGYPYATTAAIHRLQFDRYMRR